MLSLPLLSVLFAQSPALPFQAGPRAENADAPVARFLVDPAAPERWFDALGHELGERPSTPTLRPLAGLSVSHHATGAAPEGDAPGSPTFTPDGTRILVPHWESKNLIEWDVASGAFVRAIALSGSPLDVAVTPDGLRALTANGFEDTLSFVDLVSGTETGTLALGNQPGIVAISPTGAHAAVGNTAEGTLSIIDLASGLELHRVGGLSYAMLLSINFESG
ncbi:MAG: YncE family protein, partial [Planctomycetota bacterium]